MKPSVKPQIGWSAMLKVEDIQPRISRHGYKYCTVYTNAGLSVCTSEQKGARLCLYEPYEMKGLIKPFNGGSYLKAESFELFDASSFKNAFSS